MCSRPTVRASAPSHQPSTSLATTLITNLHCQAIIHTGTTTSEASSRRHLLARNQPGRARAAQLPLQGEGGPDGHLGSARPTYSNPHAPLAMRPMPQLAMVPPNNNNSERATVARQLSLAASVAEGAARRQRATSTQDAEQAFDEEMQAASDGDTIEMRGASALLRALQHTCSRVGARPMMCRCVGSCRGGGSMFAHHCTSAGPKRHRCRSVRVSATAAPAEVPSVLDQTTSAPHAVSGRRVLNCHTGLAWRTPPWLVVPCSCSSARTFRAGCAGWDAAPLWKEHGANA